jgi:hypothetical protein
LVDADNIGRDHFPDKVQVAVITERTINPALDHYTPTPPVGSGPVTEIVENPYEANYKNVKSTPDD